MKPRTCLAIAAVVAAAGALPATAQTSVKSGDGYVYAPTTLGSRNPQPYVVEPTASAVAGLEAPAERLGSIVEALNAEGSLKGSKKAGPKGGGRGGGGGGGGGGGAGGASFDDALNQGSEIVMGQNAGPDLTNAQLRGPMANGGFVSGCGAPNDMKVTVRVAVKNGHAVGVSVATNPPNGGVASCVDRHVRGLSWPTSPKLDSFTTVY